MHPSSPRAPIQGELFTSSASETQEIGRRIGVVAPPASVLALVGPLGAGKTQLAKGVAVGLGIDRVVNSPTFVLMNEHLGRMRMYHIDAYRLDDPDDAMAAGLFDERQADGVTVIEWADRLEGWLPAERLEIHLESIPGEPERRRLRWAALGDEHVRAATEALSAS